MENEKATYSVYINMFKKEVIEIRTKKNGNKTKGEVQLEST